MASSSVKPGIVQHDDRAAQRAERLAVDDEDGGNGERPVSARADEVELVEQSTDTAQRFAEHLDSSGKSQPLGRDGRGVSGHDSHYLIPAPVLGTLDSPASTSWTTSVTLPHE